MTKTKIIYKKIFFKTIIIIKTLNLNNFFSLKKKHTHARTTHTQTNKYIKQIHIINTKLQKKLEKKNKHLKHK